MKRPLKESVILAGIAILVPAVFLSAPLNKTKAEVLPAADETTVIETTEVETTLSAEEMLMLDTESYLNKKYPEYAPFMADRTHSVDGNKVYATCPSLSTDYSITVTYEDGTAKDNFSEKLCGVAAARFYEEALQTVFPDCHFRVRFSDSFCGGKKPTVMPDTAEDLDGMYFLLKVVGASGYTEPSELMAFTHDWSTERNISLNVRFAMTENQEQADEAEWHRDAYCWSLKSEKVAEVNYSYTDYRQNP